MSYIAKHMHAPVGAQKARLIIDMIRGKDVSDALNILKFCPQRSAKMIYAVICSAQANAEAKGVKDVETLKVTRAWVDEGFKIKRFRPRSRGMANGYVRYRSHLCVELDVVE